MSDSPEHPTETTGPVSAQTVTAAPPPPAPPAYIAPQPSGQSRLTQVAAWVGIVAGSVFIVAVIFGTGFMVGKHSGDRGFDRHEAVMFKHRAGAAVPDGADGRVRARPVYFPRPRFPAAAATAGAWRTDQPGPARP